MNIDLTEDEVYELYIIFKMEEFRKGFNFKHKELLNKIIVLKGEINKLKELQNEPPNYSNP